MLINTAPCYSHRWGGLYNAKFIIGGTFPVHHSKSFHGQMLGSSSFWLVIANFFIALNAYWGQPTIKGWKKRNMHPDSILRF